MTKSTSTPDLSQSPQPSYPNPAGYHLRMPPRSLKLKTSQSKLTLLSNFFVSKFLYHRTLVSSRHPHWDFIFDLPHGLVPQVQRGTEFSFLFTHSFNKHALSGHHAPHTCGGWEYSNSKQNQNPFHQKIYILVEASKQQIYK